MPTPLSQKPLVVVETTGTDLGERITERLAGWGYRVQQLPAEPIASTDVVRGSADVLLRDLSEEPEGVPKLSFNDRSPGSPPTILVGADPDLPATLAANRRGAAAVVSSPVDWTALRDAVSVAVHSSRRHRRFEALATRVTESGGPTLMLGSDPVPDWLGQLDRISASSAPILLWGEAGTGKQTLARSIHALSQCPGPFVALHGGSVTRAGTVKATGTEPNIIAAWERATGGTLLVDDVTSLDRQGQWVLAGLLEAQSGRHGSPASEVRLVGLCTSDPASSVEDGDLGEDLFYRAVFVLPTIPLRKRRDQIRAYAHHFMADVNGRHGLGVEGLSSEVLEALQRAPWPGNLPELRSTVERACILAESGFVDLHHLPPYVRRQRSGPPEEVAIPVGTSAAEAERRLILATLERTGYNKAEAARQLQVDVKTIRNKLRSYGLG